MQVCFKGIDTICDWFLLNDCGREVGGWTLALLSHTFINSKMNHNTNTHKHTNIDGTSRLWTDYRLPLREGEDTWTN